MTGEVSPGEIIRHAFGAWNAGDPSFVLRGNRANDFELLRQRGADLGDD
jgi:hypothetical protein